MDSSDPQSPERFTAIRFDFMISRLFNLFNFNYFIASYCAVDYYDDVDILNECHKDRIRYLHQLTQ